jgi:hypothetical protein
MLDPSPACARRRVTHNRAAMTIERDFSPAERALSQGNSAGLAAALRALVPSESPSPATDQLVSYALAKYPMVRPSLSGTDAVFLDMIDVTKRILAGQNADAAAPSHLHIDVDLDFIGDVRGPDYWSIPQILSFLLLGQIKPTRRAAVVGTMRDDGIYALEWIAYYRALGFERIFIYTNDNADRSDELLRLLAAQNVITLIESETSRKVAPEVKAYEHSVQLLPELRDYQWVLYADSDEFLAPAASFDNSIMAVLAALDRQFAERLPSAVCYPWLWFISDMVYNRSTGLMIERFQHARPHWITKALVRLQDIISMRHEHFPDVKPGGFLVNSAFELVPYDVRTVWAERSPNYRGGRMNHYWPKSFEEFAIKKGRGQTLDLEENLYDRPFELFFQWNGYKSPDNSYPIDPTLLARVKRHVRDLRSLGGVAELVDEIDRQFPALLRRYYSGGPQLRSLYRQHKAVPTEM